MSAFIVSARTYRQLVSVPHPVLDAQRIGVALGGRPVLHDVTFQVQAGERIALIGPNGAGKTTLLRTLIGLLPYSGTLQLAGRSLTDWSARDRAKEIALVRQQTPLAVDFTVTEIVALGRAPHLGWMDTLADADRQRVDAALDALDLHELVDRPVPSLSGGEQQRVFLAQALAQDAPLLLLDEPTAHLDIRHQLDLMRRVQRLADQGRTVIAAIHDLELAARFADRILMLADGHMVADGTPEEVLTPARLRNVFGVEAEVDVGVASLRIQYLEAV
ncbi:MAG: ABC transporter ATP-binding protein [Rubricoccaceae bacterium]